MTPDQAEEIFPTECHFKIISLTASDVSGPLNQVLRDRGRTEEVCAGNQSAAGRYVTYNVSLEMETLEKMRELDAAFRAVEGVRMVL